MWLINIFHYHFLDQKKFRLSYAGQACKQQRTGEERGELWIFNSVSAVGERCLSTQLPRPNFKLVFSWRPFEDCSPSGVLRAGTTGRTLPACFHSDANIGIILFSDLRMTGVDTFTALALRVGKHRATHLKHVRNNKPDFFLHFFFFPPFQKSDHNHSIEWQNHVLC